MKNIFIVLLSTAFLFVFLNNSISKINLHEGEWEMTVTTRVKGMPFPMPPVTYRECLTHKNMNPQKAEKNQRCKEISSSVKGNTYSWVMECTSSKGTSKSTGSITYRGKTLKGKITTVSQGMYMEQTISGHRVGPCPR